MAALLLVLVMEMLDLLKEIFRIGEIRMVRNQFQYDLKEVVQELKVQMVTLLPLLKLVDLVEEEDILVLVGLEIIHQ
tara:strand:+ start:57 stop:287 length:231 start_codon:yes stop_codon:yes gene_type:complete